jgi:hypothetical protein
MNTNDSLLLAYIDPGTGSFLLQMLIAGAVGTIAYFRKTVFGLFRRNKDQDSSPDDPEESSAAVDPKSSEPDKATNGAKTPARGAQETKGA